MGFLILLKFNFSNYKFHISADPQGYIEFFASLNEFYKIIENIGKKQFIEIELFILNISVTIQRTILFSWLFRRRIMITWKGLTIGFMKTLKKKEP